MTESHDFAPSATPEAAQNAVVWTEIPVADLTKAQAFYEAALNTTMKAEQMGPDMTVVFPYDGGVSGHLYEGRPAGDGRGPSISLAVTDPLPEVMDRVRAAGGEVISEAITIPFGSFFYATDPDGNSLSFFRY
ncbi:VOC family protein [Jannaschia donghaensis]|uniref:Putative enzyme related to lactoylglutathione lyase n=1 Tax=Jannaschia donghaensis TaxID=420998 RepID=A0A0M6YKH3_9RHOB|nr:VOC family protein [Jannaschia donghaensis]CTQ50862.1 putative enzyme related to lactoylglutathione lyase [Jannaschia donghaensis]